MGADTRHQFPWQAGIAMRYRQRNDRTKLVIRAVQQMLKAKYRVTGFVFVCLAVVSQHVVPGKAASSSGRFAAGC